MRIEKLLSSRTKKQGYRYPVFRLPHETDAEFQQRKRDSYGIIPADPLCDEILEKAPYLRFLRKERLNADIQ